MLQLSSYKSFLCLNGELPSSGFFTGKNLPIIAADGAADLLASIGIKPDVIIGDLDSVNQENHQNSTIIHTPDQSKTDFEKALFYIKQHQLEPCLVLGASGGFLDHILNNINVIIENDVDFYSAPIVGKVIKAGGDISLSLPLNTKISLFGISSCKVSSEGLKWDLDDAVLEFPGVNSSLNRTALENVSIQVMEGILLLLIYDTIIEDKGGL